MEKETEGKKCGLRRTICIGTLLAGLHLRLHKKKIPSVLLPPANQTLPKGRESVIPLVTNIDVIREFMTVRTEEDE